MSKRTWVVGLVGVVGVASLSMIGRCRASSQPAGGGRRRRRQELVGRNRLTAGRLSGLMYRAMSRHPDEDVSDLVLADRIRSSIGPLEHQLDLPRVHVMVHDHVAMLHGDVSDVNDADRLSEAVKAVSGVRGVESYLHVGLLASDTRPSEGHRGLHPASRALDQLLTAARETGAGDAPLFAVHAVLVAFLDLVPPDEREHVLAHLPRGVRAILTSPERLGEHRAKARSVDQLVALVAASDPHLEATAAGSVVTAVLRVLHELVPEERDDIAAVLPHEIRDMWRGLGSPAIAQS